MKTTTMFAAVTVVVVAGVWIGKAPWAGTVEAALPATQSGRTAYAEEGVTEVERALLVRVLPRLDELGLMATLRGESARRDGASCTFWLPRQPTPRGELRREVLLRLEYSAVSAAPGALWDRWATGMSAVSPQDASMGSATGDPIGADLVRAGWLPNDQYGVACRDLDGFACEASIECHLSSTHPQQGSASPAEVWLVEQVVRRMIAGHRGLPLELNLGPPADWIAIPRQVKVNGELLQVPPLADRWPWRGEARGKPVPKPVSIGDVAFVHQLHLEAMAVQVHLGDWAWWGQPKPENARPLDTIWLGHRDPRPDLSGWLDCPKDLTISLANRHLNFILGEPTAVAGDGTVIALPAPGRLLDGYPVVPLQPVADYFGLEVEVLPGADWSGDQFATWLDAVSPEKPPPTVWTEPPPTVIDEGLLAKVEQALIAREKAVTGLHLAYVTEHTFDPEHAAGLRRRGQLPNNVATEWLLRWDWLLTAAGRRVDVTPLEPEAEGVVPWRYFHTEPEAGILPDGVPGLVQRAWRWDNLGPMPLLRGWRDETWSALLGRAERIELTAEEYAGRPHLRLMLQFGPARQNAPQLTVVVPRDALGSPAWIEWSGDMGPFRLLEQLTIDGWQRSPGGGSVPTGLAHREWRHDYGKPRHELSTTIYRDITVAPASATFDPRDLESLLPPLLR